MSLTLEDLEKMQQQYPDFRIKGNEVYVIAFSADGKTLISGGKNKIIKKLSIFGNYHNDLVSHQLRDGRIYLIFVASKAKLWRCIPHSNVHLLTAVF